MLHSKIGIIYKLEIFEVILRNIFFLCKNFRQCFINELLIKNNQSLSMYLNQVVTITLATCIKKSKQHM